jgi:3-hydroxy acid dehydrogenase / malonic semialdehyde reductase
MKVVAITGATGNLGSHLVTSFSQSEWSVHAVGRSAAAESTAAVTRHSFESSDLEACRSFWQSLELDDSTSTCLVNNAGAYFSGPLLDQPASAIVDAITGCHFTAAHMTRALLEITTRARIVNIVSTSALVPYSSNSAYGAAKVAMAHFFSSLQEEYAGSELRVTNLYPGDLGAGAIEFEDLATYVESLASANTSIHIRDATLLPTSHRALYA